ncbi:hypothetical protein ACFWOT_09370 [Streptomyces sp. NPDC058440]|uniref:hypothetical protein n=1 Tax=Streptomyces sp. NPDC058440 TaxID=3346501 RepID=UPI00364F9BBE
MKLSELIADAERTLKEFGDIPVVVPDPGCSCCSTGDFNDAESSVEKNSVQVWGEGWVPVSVPIAFIVA